MSTQQTTQHPQLSVGRRRSRRTNETPSPAGDTSASDLLSELMVLREENAWLKAAQHQPDGIGQAIQRVRALPNLRAQSADEEDDAAQLVVEAHVLREGLLELCDEMERALCTIRTQLDALPVDQRHEGGGALIHINATVHEAG
jgi:hypothetical protein